MSKFQYSILCPPNNCEAISNNFSVVHSTRTVTLKIVYTVHVYGNGAVDLPSFRFTCMHPRAAFSTVYI